MSKQGSITAAVKELELKGWCFELIPGEGYAVTDVYGNSLKDHGRSYWKDLRNAIDAIDSIEDKGRK